MEAPLLVLLAVRPALPSTHWIITEAGKIEAQVFNPTWSAVISAENQQHETNFQPDSIFFLRQPHDFVAFIHQVSCS
jgi:hypothetical protein